MSFSSIAAEPKKVLLVNPPWVARKDNYRTRLVNGLPPLGLLSIAANLRRAGHHIEILDIHIERLCPAETKKRMKAAAPDIVGVTTMTPTAVQAHLIARLAKSLDKPPLVVFGGVHAEAVPEEILSDPNVDAVVRGDGEIPMQQLADGVSMPEVRGVSYRSGDAVVHNQASELVTDLSRYPMPAYDLVPMDLYFPTVGSYRNLPAINMVMTRGCPGKCVFCNSALTPLRTRDAAVVIDEITHLVINYGIRQIQFYDDTFTVCKQNVIKFCELMIERKLGVTWYTMIRADCFNEKMGRLMKQAGCHQVLIGVETGDEQIAESIGKPIAKEKYIKTAALARRLGIEVKGSYIIGHVGETWETMQKTLEFAMALDTDMAQFNISTPYPGTQLFLWAKQQGLLKHERWEEYERSSVLINLPGLSEEDLLRFERYAFRRYHLRPKALWRLLRRITSKRQLRDMATAASVFLLCKTEAASSNFGQWKHYRKSDFLQFDYWQDVPDRLTYELRA